MGILKAISDALKEKAKEEVIKYLKKIAEEQEKTTAAKPSKPHDRREEHKTVSAYPSEREEEHRRRDPERDQHDRFERRDRHDREQSSSERGDRDDRWQERLDKYREKYRDDFRGQRDHDRDRGREGERDRAREGSLHQDKEKPISPRIPEPQATTPAQKPVSSQPMTPPQKPDAQPQPLTEQKAAPAPVKAVSSLPQKKEWIAPLNDQPIEKVQIALGTDDAAVPVDLGRMIQQLPPLEYALYLKLYLYSFSIRKNYGYVGAGLKKNVGLAELDPAEFDGLLHRLEKRGLISLEKISEFQSTYVLYLPFDAERMSRVEEKKEEGKEEDKEEKSKPTPAVVVAPQKETKASLREEKASQTKSLPKKGKEKEAASSAESSGDKKKDSEPKGKRKGARSAKEKGRRQEPETEPAPPAPEQEVETPGTAHISMDEEQLLKSYRTFVSMEIDKAKMRVGRSNFDKIYMEAVKYIDKKYGFKVLSDQERFREYLTQYYISAFDIPSFEEWKKSKA